MKKINDILLELAQRVFRLLPTRNTIVFESNPDFACNTYPVYRYLIDEKHIDDTFKIVWLVSDPEKYKNAGFKNTCFMKYPSDLKSIPERFMYHYTICTARSLVYCNRLLGKHDRRQYSICLQHGMPLKKSNGSYCINDECDNCLCVSEFFADIYSEDFRISKEKLVYMGFPRNDYLFSDNDALERLGFSGYDKVFLWLPTYRSHSRPDLIVSDFNIKSTDTGIPSINTIDEIRRIDEWLRKNNCLIVLKPHPAQNISLEIQSELTNFKIISNDLLEEKGIQLYELIGKTDALISDYSSVYYDYLLTDKPIGLTVDDLESYTAVRGFVYEDVTEILKGEYINNTDDLLSFLRDVKDGNDKYREERFAVRDRIHTVRDASSAKQVGDLIYENLCK